MLGKKHNNVVNAQKSKIWIIVSEPYVMFHPTSHKWLLDEL